MRWSLVREPTPPKRPTSSVATGCDSDIDVAKSGLQNLSVRTAVANPFEEHETASEELQASEQERQFDGLVSDHRALRLSLAVPWRAAAHKQGTERPYSGARRPPGVVACPFVHQETLGEVDTDRAGPRGLSWSG